MERVLVVVAGFTVMLAYSFGLTMMFSPSAYAQVCETQCASYGLDCSSVITRCHD